ncbi:TetR/AcrR family transcriptional regulator [Aquibacillus kalidii]|uniref:TetR/AcrR family transcriptional regulator n=1 Tax=Aquibacillus kalidii TaxID=2762597 RepID=UPI0016447DF3|nr:TetR/AcrR family transcriptional regulator [Aquibacillus kalidii]
MNSRKQHVIRKSHELFIERGFQATSIQDILDYSGISKGTFYNYFTSKNELLISIFRELHSKMEQERNELLIGQDPSDINVFVQQFELQMYINKKNRLTTLFEEVLISNDPELKQFLKRAQLKVVEWTYKRFVEIFGEEKKPYLLDCAIMFIGILQQNMKFYVLDHDRHTGISRVVQYSVKRVERIVEELALSKDQLHDPSSLDKWLPDHLTADRTFQEELNEIVNELKTTIRSDKPDDRKYLELINFIQEELLHETNPRPFLLENALQPLINSELFNPKEVGRLSKLVSRFFKKKT